MKDTFYLDWFNENIKKRAEIYKKGVFKSDYEQKRLIEEMEWAHWFEVSKIVTLSCSILEFSKAFSNLDDLVDFVFSKPFLERLATINNFSINDLKVLPQSHSTTVTPSLREFLLPEQTELLGLIVQEIRQVLIANPC